MEEYPQNDFYFWLGEDGELTPLSDVGFQQKAEDDEDDATA